MCFLTHLLFGLIRYRFRLFGSYVGSVGFGLLRFGHLQAITLVNATIRTATGREEILSLYVGRSQNVVPTEHIGIEQAILYGQANDTPHIVGTDIMQLIYKIFVEQFVSHYVIAFATIDSTEGLQQNSHHTIASSMLHKATEQTTLQKISIHREIVETLSFYSGHRT